MSPREGDQRTARRLANDAAIRVAALAEASARGLDALGPTAVARSAGLTTGAVYARHEDTTELAVDLWQSILSGAFTGFVAMVAEAVGGDRTDRAGAIDRLVAALGDPSPELVVSLEAILVARRTRALAEEVHPDVVSAFDAVGAGPQTSDPDGRAKLTLALAIAVGLVVMGAWGPAGRDGVGEVDWPAALDNLATNFEWSVAQRPGSDLEVPEGWFPGPDDLDDDPTRSRLMHAAMRVIAQSGVERATATRIARRAGLSHGAIYGSFTSKDALVAATVRTVADRLGTEDARRGTETLARSGNFGAALAMLYLGRLSDERVAWQSFRLECLAASRWSPEVAAALNEVLTPMLTEGAVTLGQLLGSSLPVARAQRQMVFGASPGYTLLSTVASLELDSVEWWRSASLLGPPSQIASGGWATAPTRYRDGATPDCREGT